MCPCVAKAEKPYKSSLPARHIRFFMCRFCVQPVYYVCSATHPENYVFTSKRLYFAILGLPAHIDTKLQQESASKFNSAPFEAKHPATLAIDRPENCIIDARSIGKNFDQPLGGKV